MSRRRRRRRAKSVTPRTVDYLTSSNPGGDAYASYNGFTVPDGRAPNSRLCFRVSSAAEFRYETLVDTIAHPNNEDIDWFFDTNMFLAPTDDSVWEALFARDNRLALAAPIVAELEMWLEDPRCNLRAQKKLIEARDVGKTPSVRLVMPPPSGSDLRVALEYYVRLLGTRKDSHKAAQAHIQSTQQELPTNQDISNFCKDTYGVRGQLMARKGMQNTIPHHIFNDEAFVMLAIFSALTSNQETVIVTRDEDVFEQFYKALWFLDTHYRSMLMAEIYANDPFAYPVRRIRDKEHLAFADEVRLLKKPSSRLLEVLPSAWDPISLHCLFIRSDTVSQLSFCAEANMRRVIGMKGQTRGKNTCNLENNNCHVYLGPLMEKWGDFAAVGVDCTVTVADGLCELSMIDINLALMSMEGLERNRITNVAL